MPCSYIQVATEDNRAIFSIEQSDEAVFDLFDERFLSQKYLIDDNDGNKTIFISPMSVYRTALNHQLQLFWLKKYQRYLHQNFDTNKNGISP
jgi:hypothetical protein